MAKSPTVHRLFLRLMAMARFRLTMQLLLIFLLIWWGSAVVIWLQESGEGQRVQTFGDALFFTLATMTTSGEAGIGPTHALARWVLGFAMFSSKLLTALLCALAAAMLIEYKVKEDMGLRMHRFQHHVVLIGWNLKGSQIIQTLRADETLHKREVVVVADLDSKPDPDPLVFFNRSPYPLRGEAIERAALSEADTIVVLANYAEKHHADALSAVNCMTARHHNPKARIIAELLDPSQRKYLEMAGADDIVGIGEVGGFLIAEATIGRQQARDLLTYVKQGRHKAGAN
ncbi:MAG: hypothetical protein E6Q92_10875 [Burkholderiaceae bacterium]|nr:MAG: hypothetical protein E6Q92_10875 [Burkholderiaceae bacterium]